MYSTGQNLCIVVGMMFVESIPESTPSRDFDAELHRQEQHLRPRVRAIKWGIHLRILPRRTDLPWIPGQAAWWYRLQWVIPARCEHTDQYDVPDDCRRFDFGVGVHPGWHVIGEAGTLPMPPKLPTPVITDEHIDEFEQRQPGVTQFYGGREKIREWLQRNTDQIWTGPPSSNQIDWPAYVRDLIDRYNTDPELEPPQLTAEQRVIATAGRLVRAEEEVAAAKRSLAAQMQAARKERVAERGTERGLVSQLRSLTGLNRKTVTDWLAHNPADGDVPAEVTE